MVTISESNLVQELYAIMEIVSDRAEMHKNICPQSYNWNALLLNSVNGMTATAWIITGLASVAGSGASILPLTLSASLLYISITRILLVMNKIQPSPLPLLGTMIEKFPSRMEPESKHEKVGKEAAERKGWDEKLEEEMKGVLGMVRGKDGAETRDHFEKGSRQITVFLLFHKTQDKVLTTAFGFTLLQPRRVSESERLKKMMSGLRVTKCGTANGQTSNMSHHIL